MDGKVSARRRCTVAGWRRSLNRHAHCPKLSSFSDADHPVANTFLHSYRFIPTHVFGILQLHTLYLFCLQSPCTIISHQDKSTFLLKVTREQPSQLLLGCLLATSRCSDTTSEFGLTLEVLSKDQISVVLLTELVENATDEAASVL